MRVLHVVGNLDPDAGGSTSAAFHTSGYLRKHGVDAELAGTWDGPESADHITEQWPELPIHGFPRQAPHHYWRSPALRRWLRDEVASYDVIVVNGLFKFPFVDAAGAARRANVPYLVQPHGSLDPYDLRKHRVLKEWVYGPLVARRLLRNAAGVVVTSERERRHLVTYGVDCHVSVVPLPVVGPAAAGDGARIRRSIGVDDAAPVVLFLSRIDPKKGLERLLEALRALSGSHPGLTLVIVGAAEDASYEAGLRKLSVDLDVSESVVWAGLLLGEDKWDAFAAGDVFALPSDYENFGIVVLEALLAERPIVISEGVDISDELAAAGVAYLCGQDVPSLVSKLDEALTDGSRSADMARRGRTVVEASFSPDAATAAAIAAYEAAASPKS
jgi:glycosyltransferase involved in cell wall biosynthesis